MSSADPSGGPRPRPVAAHRSYLFAPGSDPRVMRKALEAGADAVVLDLEDAVDADRKDDARAAITELLAELAVQSVRTGHPALHVRINRLDDGYDSRDLDVAVHPSVEALRLPKAEDPDAIRATAEAVAKRERTLGMPVGSVRLYPTIESARGVLRAEAIIGSDPRVVRLVLGQADLVADLGGRGDDALTTIVPRALVALASRSAGISAPVDGATTGLSDERVLRDALAQARALGFYGKSAIHPRQLAAIHETFTPGEAELAHAERVVAAAEAAGGVATTLDGELVDVAIVRRARDLLALRREQ
jgi:citrate lyase subunit beta / citryl-CoA lyase